MPIICFEGASAVGKTTVSAYLRDNYNAYVVPEVNLLFERKPDEPKFWYFEKQIERWQIALRAAQAHKIVVLDGDPFQPLWYNWAYDFDFGESFQEILDFYQKALLSGAIDFPGKYFLFTAGIDELRNRKAGDSYRTRKNFERHLRFIAPQLAYFSYIKSVTENLVETIENNEIAETAGRIISSTRLPRSDHSSSLELFSEIEKWLSASAAAEFES